MILLIVISLFIITGCNLNKEDSKSNYSEKAKIADNIVLGEKVYIKQLKQFNISGTKDYFMVTEERNFNSNDNDNVSWSISVPYKFNIDGIDYNGYCILGENEKCVDNNPKYNISMTNLRKENNENYSEILINKK